MSTDDPTGSAARAAIMRGARAKADATGKTARATGEKKMTAEAKKAAWSKAIKRTGSAAPVSAPLAPATGSASPKPDTIDRRAAWSRAMRLPPADIPPT